MIKLIKIEKTFNLKIAITNGSTPEVLPLHIVSWFTQKNSRKINSPFSRPSRQNKCRIFYSHNDN